MSLKIGIVVGAVGVLIIYLLILMGGKQSPSNKIVVTSINSSNRLVVISINGKQYNAYIAATPLSQQIGLMNRTSIGDCYGRGSCIGMLFVFQSDSIECFWMKNTWLPLNQYWIENNTVTNVHVGIPNSTHSYCYMGNMILETNTSSGVKLLDTVAIVSSS